MKKLLYLLLGLVLLVVVAFVAVMSMVDTDKIKTLLVEQVREQTGAQLVINGELSWRIFPTLGFSLGETQLKNPAGFPDKALISIQSASLDVELMPLLDKHVKVGELLLNGAEIHLLTRKDGVSNLSLLTAYKKTTASAESQVSEPTATEEVGGSAMGDMKITLAGIRIEQGHLLVEDLKAGTKQEVANINLFVSRFAPGESVDVNMSALYKQADLSADLKSKFKLMLSKDFDLLAISGLDTSIDLVGRGIPSGEKRLTLKGELNYRVSNKLAEFSPLNMTFGDIGLSGKASVKHTVIPQIRFDLTSENIDLDKLMAEMSSEAENKPAAKGSAAAPATTASSNKAATQPDLSALSSVDLAGKLTMKAFKSGNANVQDIVMNMMVKGGVAELSSFSAKLYDGTVTGNAKLNGKGKMAIFSATKQLKGVQARPLLKDVAEIDMLSGAMNMTANLKGVGLDELSIRKSLNGQIKLAFTDGALYGVNIPLMIRKGYAQLKQTGETFADEPEKTDFSSLTGTFNIAKGKAQTNDLQMLSPLIRIKGDGFTELVTEKIDFLVNTSLVGTLAGQGGKSEQDLKKLTIPVKIAGVWSKPSYGLDMDTLLKQELKQEIDKQKEKLQEKLKEKLEKEGADKLLEGLNLKGLFN